MAINYVVTKKVDTTKGETNVRYYATTRALQKKPVDSAEIARQLAEKSSLQDGDVMSVLVQLSGVIIGFKDHYIFFFWCFLLLNRFLLRNI